MARTVIFAGGAFTTIEDGSAVAAITGTAATGLTEQDVVDGGETIVITLTADTWVADDGTFAAQRQSIINGLNSNQSFTTGWNAEVRDKEVVGAVVRTSDTVVTITLSAAAAFDISANETVTVTVPASAVVGGIAIVASPSFLVSAEGALQHLDPTLRHADSTLRHLDSTLRHMRATVAHRT